MFKKAEVVLVDITEVKTRLDASQNTLDVAKPFAHHGVLMFFTLLWGGNFVLAEVALLELSPISFSVARFFVAGMVMLGVLYVQGKSYARKHRQPFRFFPVIEKQDRLRLVAVSVLGATLAPWLGIEGLNLTSGGRASLWLALCPVLSAGMGYLMRTECLRKMGMSGLFIAGIGTVGLAADGLDPSRSFWLGDLLLCLAICCTAAELHLIKPLVIKYSSTSMVAARTVLGGSLYLLLASPSLMQQTWFSLGSWTWIAIIAGGAIGVGVGQWVKVRALEALGPTRVVLYGNLVPPATLFLAWVALGSEPPQLEILAGALILFGAMLLQVGDPHRPDDVRVSANEF
jgi:drug/metabolite transporter (DMT)-like permease